MNKEEIKLLKDIKQDTENLRNLLIKNTNDLIYKSKINFNIFCCSLDAIEDSYLAIEFYFKNGLGNEAGEKYLKLWGLLQSIIIQQDAIIELYKLVNIQYQCKSAFKSIRDVRIQISGHPVAAKYGKLLCYTTRCSIDNDFIDVIMYDKERISEDSSHINYRVLIFEYLNELDICLKDLYKLNSN
ncbi:MAG: hypothetical protein PHV37_07915 [Candidatus Gastranaerophilales bacterium]|nr:hypothetical protein [Candidatus Gastranaerophilales bacterium]